MSESTKSLPDYIENTASDLHRRLAVPADCAGLRLDQALVRLLPEYSRNRLQEWMRSGHVTLDGGSASAKTKVWGGETVVVAPQALPSSNRHGPEQIPLAILFEDADILVIDKPAGLVVHPGSGNWSGTLLNALLRHAPALAGVPRAGIVHRLGDARIRCHRAWCLAARGRGGSTDRPPSGASHPHGCRCPGETSQDLLFSDRARARLVAIALPA
jgi:hypothetical protein